MGNWCNLIEGFKSSLCSLSGASLGRGQGRKWTGHQEASAVVQDGGGGGVSGLAVVTHALSWMKEMDLISGELHEVT